MWGPPETRLYLWGGLIVLAERVQVSSSEQLPRQPGRLAEPLHAWLPSVAWPSELPLPTYRMRWEWGSVMLCLGWALQPSCCMTPGKSPLFFGFQFFHLKLKFKQITPLLPHLQLSATQKPELGIQGPL